MYGITTPPSADPPETRAVVFTTDQTTPVQWYAEDVDRCTGDITERAIQLVTPQQNAPVGRVVYRMGKQLYKLAIYYGNNTSRDHSCHPSYPKRRFPLNRRHHGNQEQPHRW